MSSVCFSFSNPRIYGYSFVIADFNNDGNNDKYEINDQHSMVSLSQDGQELTVTYQIHESRALNNEIMPTVDGIPTNVISTDVDNDGFTDIIATFGSRVVIRKNNNSGDFTEVQQFISLSDLYDIEETLISESLAQHAAKLAALDINSDGYDDLLIVHANGLSIFLNDTVGFFNHLKNQSLTDFAGKSVESVYVSDLDVDSMPEVIISTRGSYVIYFTAEVNLDVVSIANQSDSLDIVDYDNDGDLDLSERELYEFCQTPREPEFRVYWINNGNGLFSEELVYPGDVVHIDPIVVESPSVETELNTANPASGGGGLSYLLIIAILRLLFSRILLMRSKPKESICEKPGRTAVTY